jgi:hypothetical protein
MTNETPVISEVDCSTGVQTERAMTDAEIASWQALREEAVRIEAERVAEEQAKTALKESARAKLIAGEPLTEEEAATIVL